MRQTFAQVVEHVKQLSLDERQELQRLLRNYLSEERRLEILENGTAGIEEWRDGKLTPFEDIDKLRDSLSDS